MFQIHNTFISKTLKKAIIHYGSLVEVNQGIKGQAAICSRIAPPRQGLYSTSGLQQGEVGQEQGEVGQE